MCNARGCDPTGMISTRHCPKGHILTFTQFANRQGPRAFDSARPPGSGQRGDRVAHGRSLTRLTVVINSAHSGAPFRIATAHIDGRQRLLRHGNRAETKAGLAHSNGVFHFLADAQARRFAHSGDEFA